MTNEQVPTRRDTLATQTTELNRAAVAAMSDPFQQWRVGSCSGGRMFDAGIDRAHETVHAAARAGLGAYAPLRYQAIRKRGDRRKRLVVTPLLGSYFFAHTAAPDAEDRFKRLFDSSRASVVIGSNGYPMQIAGATLLEFVNANRGHLDADRVSRLVAHHTAGEIERPYADGVRLRVRTGPLSGVEGVCAGYQGRDVILRINFLNTDRNAYLPLDAVELFA